MVDRPYLVVSPATLAGQADPDARARLVRDSEFPVLAQLLLDAYAGSVDDEGETFDDALQLLHDAASGEMGAPLRDAWLAIDDEAGHPMSIVLTTIWWGTPFAIFVITHPDHWGQGLATSLLRTAASVLRDAGYAEYGLLVTRTNPALALYQRLGFVERPRPPHPDGSV